MRFLPSATAEPLYESTFWQRMRKEAKNAENCEEEDT